MVSKARLLFRRNRGSNRSKASTSTTDGSERHPYAGICRIPEAAEKDEFLYYYRQHRPDSDLYPADWHEQHHQARARQPTNAMAGRQPPGFEFESLPASLQRPSTLVRRPDDLSGMLEDKMHLFNNNNSSRSAGVSCVSSRDDSQSLDSGQSSGGTASTGSHDWHGLRRRPAPAPQRQVYNRFSISRFVDEQTDSGLGAVGDSCEALPPPPHALRPATLPRDILDSWNPQLPGVDAATQKKTEEKKAAVDNSGWPRKLNCVRALAASACLLASVIILLLVAISALGNLSCQLNSSQKINAQSVEGLLRSRVFGQELAIRLITEAVEDFNLRSLVPGNVIVLYLLGWVGTGKSLTAGLLASGLPVNVHKFSGPMHFGRPGSAGQALDDLTLAIRVSCGPSIVVVDDVDEADDRSAAELAGFVRRLADQPSKGNGTLVVLTASAGASHVNQAAVGWAKAGGGEATADAVISVLASAGVELPVYAGLASADVDVRLVPFLPLGRDHVRQCVSYEMRSRGIDATRADVDTVVDEIHFSTDEFPAFASSGCKRVGAKVDLVVGATTR